VLFVGHTELTFPLKKSAYPSPSWLRPARYAVGLFRRIHAAGCFPASGFIPMAWWCSFFRQPVTCHDKRWA